MRKIANEELQRLDAEGFKKASKIPLVIVLDNVRSLNNVGSAFRTADSFRIEGIILTGITGKPPHRDIHKTALGATESVAWEYHESAASAIQDLKSKDFRICLVEQTTDSISLDQYSPSSDEKYALVFGNEVKGVSEELIPLADHSIEIPQFGTKHSLNISVSIGIVIWDFCRKLGFPD